MIKALKHHYTWIIFFAAVVAQFAFPIVSIVGMNDVLLTGAEFRIKTRLVDPSDPFRGRYVAIGVEVDVPETLQYDDVGEGDLYVRLVEGSDGFGEAAEITRIPISGYGALKLRNIRYVGSALRLPFDRYYMQETAAPKAEAAYNQERRDAYVTLRIKNGVGVVSGLYIDDIRIEDYIIMME
jgi:uncharacterized membrane-anchored protein